MDRRDRRDGVDGQVIRGLKEREDREVSSGFLTLVVGKMVGHWSKPGGQGKQQFGGR